MWTAWPPWKRSDSSASRLRTGWGLFPEGPSTSVQAIARPGNSSRRIGATQPCSGTSSSCISVVGRGPGARGPQELLDFRRELSGRQLAGARVLQDPARIGVAEGRAATDSVEVRDRAVVVVADGHLPAALPHQIAHGVAAVPHVQREEVHALTVSPVDSVHHVL